MPKGRVVRFTINSAESKIFPTAPVAAPRGAPPVDPPQHQTFQRQVVVYIPAGYTPNTPTPFIVVQDGQNYDAGADGNPPTDRAFIPPMLDNLIFEKRIPRSSPSAVWARPQRQSNTTRFRIATRTSSRRNCCPVLARITKWRSQRIPKAVRRSA